METKTKKFSKKLLALFLAVVMGITCFSGVLSAYAASKDVKYTDNSVEYNSLGWAVLSDEQVATAVLDYADTMLASLDKVEAQLAGLVAGANIPVVKINWDTSARKVTVKAIGITLASVTVKLTSIDELIETLESVDGVLHGGLVNTASSLGLDLGDIPMLDFSAVSGMRRSTTSSCDMVRGVLGLIYDNIDVINKLLLGQLSLGLLNDTLNVYDLIGGLVGAPSGYQSDMIYNIAQSAILTLTKWYTPEEAEAFQKGEAEWKFDTQLLDKLTTELLDKISVLVTYGQEYTDEDGNRTKADTSATRYLEIKEYMDANGVAYATAAAALGYDPSLVYSDEFVDEDGNPANVLLFAYGSPDENGFATDATQQIALTLDDSLFTFGYQALKMAWSTVLKGTVKLIHVNYGYDWQVDENGEGHGSNFDNSYYYWMDEQGLWTGTDADYSAANVEAWAAAVYETYAAESPEQFLGWVEQNLTFDRSALVESEHGAWSTIDATKLFLKLRYSPLADKYFDIETGPINLYFLQTGTPNLDQFFENDYANYKSLVAGLNDALVAAVKDIFVESDNIIGTRPEMTKVGQSFTSVGSSEISQITTTLVANTLKMVQYTADAMDANVLNEFYTNNGAGTALTEQNIEEAMMPLLVACIGQVQLNGAGNLSVLIHPEDWDMCKDAEAVAFVALREYLSYVLPNMDYNTLVTTDGGQINATLNGTILPMARDAVFYVLESLVPVADGNGNPWTVEGQTEITYVEGVNDVFTLLNSVVCYYADQHPSQIIGTANGVASLLGVCDGSGKSLITTANSLWTNIDLVANKILPVLGVLQGKGNGNFSSYNLIWETIVEGILDIGANNGVSGFINQLLTIVSASPIQSERIVDVIYDLLKNLINGLFGPRYSGQIYVPVPERNTLTDPTNPFDSFFHVGTVVGTSTTAYGALPKLINNFLEFSGIGNRGSNGATVGVYPDSILPGLTFAVTAVNSFLSLMPAVGEHELNMATSSFKNLTTQNAKGSTTYTDVVTLTSNATGINKVYLDGMNNDAVTRMSRYYLDITNIATTASGGSISVSNNVSGFEKIAPGAKYTINVSMQTPSTINASYVVTTTYNVCDANGNAIQTGLKTTSYKYITGEKSWLDTVYPAVNGTTATELARQGDGIYWLASEPDNGKSTGSGDYVIKTTDVWQKNGNLNGTYPQSISITSSNAALIDQLGFRVKNLTGTFMGIGSSYSMDGFYVYDSKTVYNDGSNGNVTVGQANAIPVYDKATGSLLKYGKLDYLPAGAEDIEANWVRNGVDGYTESDIQGLINDGTLTTGYKTRTHVAYTLQEAINNGMIAAYHYNAQTALYEYVYMKTGTTDATKYETTLERVTLAGPVDGIYVQTGKMTIEKNTSQYFAPFKYDGSTQLVATDKNINICFYNSGKSGTGSIHFVIADDSSKETLVEAFNYLSSVLDNYTPADFTDYDGSQSALYNEVQAQLIDALKAYAQPITPSNGASLSDQTVLTALTHVVGTDLGDRAFVPYSVDDASDLPTDIRARVTFGDDGIVYLDEAMTMPLYSNVPVDLDPSEADEDGIAVDDAWKEIKLGEDGRWYLLNAPAYVTEWITDDGVHAYPIVADTEEQLTDSKGVLQYNQINYIFFDAEGKQVGSNDEWIVKVPDAEKRIIPYDSANEYRGLFTQVKDNLKYYEELVYAALDTSTANNLFEQITLARTGLNQSNFDQITFQRMVEAARAAERKFNVLITYVPEDEEEEATFTFSPTDAAGHIEWLESEGIDYTWTTESQLSQIQAAELLRLYNLYLSHTVQRGYLGDQIEAEILCASGNAYDNLTVTQAVPADEDAGTEYVPAVIRVNSGSTCDFGTVVDGVITNVDAEGNQAYTTESWNAYTEKLAAAVAIAQEGNTTYAYADKSNHVVGMDLEDYTCCNTRCYTADSELQVAENTLKPYEPEVAPEGITITGTILIATDVEGTDGDFGLVGIDVVCDGEVVATSAADGTFTAVVPTGTTELTITGPTTIDRTVAVDATADVSDVNIPICMADYTKDGYVTGPDLGTYLGSHGNVDAYDVYCDYNADGYVTGPDLGLYLVFHGQAITYADLTIA